MALNGYFFDGTTIGDATLAPYDDSEIANVFARFGNGVIEGYENELEVTASGVNGVVAVGSGAARVNGYLYINDTDTTVAVPSCVANNRIDVITLYVDTAAQTVRLNRIEGVEAANPVIPAIPSTDFPLAWLWLVSTYNAATGYPNSPYIHDLREFEIINASKTGVPYNNLIPNSEFLSFTGNGAANPAPDEWWVAGATLGTTIGSAITHARSRTVNITGAGGDLISTAVPLQKGKRYTLRGSVYINSGAVNIQVERSVVYGGSISKIITNAPGVETEFIIRFDAYPTTDYTSLSFACQVGGTDFELGQVVLVEGNVPGNYAPKHELIFANAYLTDANWNFTAKSTGTTVVDLSAAFSGNIGVYIRGLILAMAGNDSGSAGNPVKMGLYSQLAGAATDNLSQLSLEGVPNDEIRERIGYVPTNHLVSQGYFDVGVSASGAGTFDVQLRVLGVIT